MGMEHTNDIDALTTEELLRQAAALYDCAATLWQAGSVDDGDRLARMAAEYSRRAFARR